MPTHKTDWRGIIGTVIGVMVFIGTAYKVFVGERIDAAEVRIANLERGQVEQNECWLTNMHAIQLHLLSLDMNVSNALELLKLHQIKISGGKF